ncbi:hypothetical protein ACQ4M5_07660 [Leptolyngbya sp. AN10]
MLETHCLSGSFYRPPLESFVPLQTSSTADVSPDLNNPWVIIFDALRSQELQQYRSQAIAEIAERSQLAGADLTPPDFVAIAPYPVLLPDVHAQVADTPGIHPNGKVHSWSPAIATLMRDGTGTAVGINLRFLKAYLNEDDIKTVRLGGAGKLWQERAGFLPGDSHSKICLGCEGADFQSFYLNRAFRLPTYQGLGSAGAIYRDIESIKVDKEANGWTKFILCLDRPFRKDSDTEINRSVAANTAKNIIALRKIGYDVKLMAFYDHQGRWVACDDGCDHFIEVEPENFKWVAEAIQEQQTKEAKAQTERQSVYVPSLHASHPAADKKNQDLINAIADRIDVGEFDREERILIAAFYKSINDRPGFDKAWANKLPTERKYATEMEWDWKRAEVSSGNKLISLTLAIAKRLQFDLSSWSKQWWADHPEFKSSNRVSRSNSTSSKVRTPILRTRPTNTKVAPSSSQPLAAPSSQPEPAILYRQPKPMTQTTLQSPLAPLPLFNLASELVQNIIQGKQLYKNNTEDSLYQVARELRGWQNWTQSKQIRLDQAAQTFVDQAANVLELSPEKVTAILDRVDEIGDQHIPGVIYKADGSEVPAWVQIHHLDKMVFQAACPDELKPAVLDAIRQYRERVEKTVSVETSEPKKRVLPPPTRIASIPNSQTKPFEPSSEEDVEDRSPAVDVSTQEHDRSESASTDHAAVSEASSSNEPTQEPSEIKVEVPVPVSTGQAKLNTTLARLGRSIAALKPSDPDGDKTIAGKNKYTIVLNVRTNTLKIYSNDRGKEPILFDADGKIDHANSKVTQADVDAFREALKQGNEKKKISEKTVVTNLQR